MRTLAVAIPLCLLAVPAHAQPTPAQMEQQKRIMDCNARASMGKPEDRKKFMTDCMKGGASSEAVKRQQQQVRECSRRAAAKGLAGDDRMRFMGACLKS